MWNLPLQAEFTFTLKLFEKNILIKPCPFGFESPHLYAHNKTGTLRETLRKEVVSLLYFYIKIDTFSLKVS